MKSNVRVLSTDNCLISASSAASPEFCKLADHSKVSIVYIGAACASGAPKNSAVAEIDNIDVHLLSFISSPSIKF